MDKETSTVEGRVIKSPSLSIRLVKKPNIFLNPAPGQQHQLFLSEKAWFNERLETAGDWRRALRLLRRVWHSMWEGRPIPRWFFSFLFSPGISFHDRATICLLLLFLTPFLKVTPVFRSIMVIGLVALGLLSCRDVPNYLNMECK